MALYKKEGVNPAGSIVPLLIQMPILIVLYSVMQDITKPENTYFLYPFFSSFTVQSINTHILGINLLSIGGTIGIAAAIIVGATQWLQIKLSLAKNAPVKTIPEEVKELEKDIETGSFTPDPATMNAMMLYMLPTIIAISTYFFPLAIGVYWFIGSVFTTVQQLVVNRK